MQPVAPHRPLCAAVYHRLEVTRALGPPECEPTCPVLRAVGGAHRGGGGGSKQRGKSGQVKSSQELLPSYIDQDAKQRPSSQFA